MDEPTDPPDRAGVEVREPFTSGSNFGALGRALVLFGLVGASLAYTLQLSIYPDWVTEFLRSNTLEEHDRKVLLASMFGWAAVAMAGGVALAIWARRTGRDVRWVERVAWISSPISFVAAFRMMLNHGGWIDRQLDVLFSTAIFTLLFEGATARAFAASPALAFPKLRGLRDRAEALLRAHVATVSVVVFSVAYSVFMSVLAIRRHHKLGTGVYDLGISDNLMHNALDGQFMRSPIFSGNHPDPPSFIANHAQFGQYFLLPLYALHPAAETLLVIQCSLLGLSAIPLYLFSRRRISESASVVVALAYLAYPAVHGASLYEMTYIPIASFFVFMTLWALDAGRWVWFGVSLVAALSMREDIPIGLAMAGAVFALAGKRPRAAIALAVISTLYFGVVRFIIMDRAGTWIFPGTVYGELVPAGVTPSFKAVIFTVISNPAFTLSKLLKEEKVVYLLELLVPLAFLPLRRGWLVASLAPGALLTLLSTNYSAAVQIGFHYAMHWTPYLFLAIPVALSLIREEPGFGVPKMRAALAALAFATLIVTYHYGAFAGSPRFRVGFDYYDFTFSRAERERYERMKRMIALVPKDAQIAASNAIGPHVSNRKEAYLTDNDGIQDAEYAAFAHMDFKFGSNRKYLRDALVNGGYGVVYHDDDFVLLKKGPKSAGNDEVLRVWRP